MFRFTIALLFIVCSGSSFANSNLPEAINCYEKNTNSKDISKYMSCFADNAVMIDVSRTINGNDAIQAWAEREVISKGDQFKHRKILELKTGYAKTEVQWMSWVVHYYYWWNENGKITKMSLQYAN